MQKIYRQSSKLPPHWDSLEKEEEKIGRARRKKEGKVKKRWPHSNFIFDFFEDSFWKKKLWGESSILAVR